MYIIRGSYKKGNLYYVSHSTNDGKNEFAFTFNVNEATRIKDKKNTIDICMSINDNSFKIYNICPICHQEYSRPPAVSRKDNKTYICSNCGTKEALYDFINKRA